jgi:hypothetical protein
MKHPGDNAGANDWLAGHLSALPDPEPPSPLFERVMTSRTRRRRVRALSSAAVLLVGAALLWPLLRTPILSSPAEEVAAVTVDDLRLLLIDRRLQAAYDGGASDEHLAALWQARARLAAAGDTPPPTEEIEDATILSL